jgi:hypothetical protein
MNCTCAVRVGKPVATVRPFVVEVLEHGYKGESAPTLYLVYTAGVRHAWPKLQGLGVCEPGSVMLRVYPANSVGPVGSGVYDLTPPVMA